MSTANSQAGRLRRRAEDLQSRLWVESGIDIRRLQAKRYADKHYAEFLQEDLKLREGIQERYAEAAVSQVEIERQANKVSITIYTARPGIVIGRGGQRVDETRAYLEDLIGIRQTRRAFLGRAANGIGAAALATLLNPGSLTAESGAPQTADSRGVVSPLHFAPKAKRVIFLCQAGGPSHLETFDHKPKLAELHGHLLRWRPPAPQGEAAE